ncbi:MAG: SDR family oxidoreductase [Candidatus Omnitrophota bacterium]|nr:SDR family oxidoreductase [Candidatus Omnitrophota bacterium]
MKQYLDKFSLDNKVVFVLGGAGLIGEEIVQAVASAGATLILLDVNSKKAKAIVEDINASGQKAVFEYFNAMDLEKSEKQLEKIWKQYGPADVWVNASYPRTADWPQSLEKMNLRYLRKNVDAHLNSCLWLSRKIALLMKKSEVQGSIIHLGSIYGVQANDLTIYEGTKMSGEISYSAIKGGIVNFTRYLASYFGPNGIRANCVCPGGVFDHQDKQFVRHYEHKVPLKRMAKAEEIASAVLFLACEASSYVTGTTLMVDGGWTIV